MAIIAQTKRGFHFDYAPNDDDLKFMRSRGFVEPRYPYVIFRGKRIEIFGQEKAAKSQKSVHEILKLDASEVTPLDSETHEQWVYEDVVTLNVGGVHKQVSKIDKMIRRKGLRVLCWGNFPRADSQAARMLADGPGKPNPWQILDAHLRSIVGEDIQRGEREKVMAKEIADEKAKSAALMAEIDALRKGKNAGNQRTAA